MMSLFRCNYSFLCFLLFLQYYYQVECNNLFKQYYRGVGSPPNENTKSIPLPQDRWFTQKLDHFNPTNIKTWKQRYQINGTFYKSGGPAFLMIGGEGEANAKWVTTGAWISYAEKYNAFCFQLEHRYYGKSHPTDDLSTKNLQYLSSEQALADIAYFITGMNHQYKLPSNIKWITFGGSYPGSLSAWARMKYPYLIHGAVSTSGPLLAKIDFNEYFGVVRDALKTSNEDCPNEIFKANQKLGSIIKTEDGQEYIKKAYKLCDSLEDAEDEDVNSFFENISGNIASIVQYNKDNKDTPTKNITIDTICNIMLNQKNNDSLLDRYARFHRLMLEVTGQKCLDFKYSKAINNLKKISWESEASEGGRQWTYQTCTEFGFYQTSSKDNDLFGNHFNVEYYIQQCKDIFGSSFNDKLLSSSVERTNILYGALSINVGNLVFVHGSIDPWHALGIIKSNEFNLFETIFINGTAHCANMYPSSKDDLPELVEAREKISRLIGSWLTDTYSVSHIDTDPYSFRLVYTHYNSEKSNSRT